MEAHILVIFKIIFKKAKVCIHGQTGESMKENGKSRKCTEKANIHGMTVESMMASIKKI